MPANITKVPPLESGQRPETGPMQFGDDWPGIFIRGDDALADAMMIDHVLKALPQDLPRTLWMIRSVLEGLRDTLRSCSVGDTGWPPS